MWPSSCVYGIRGIRKNCGTDRAHAGARGARLRKIGCEGKMKNKKSLWRTILLMLVALGMGAGLRAQSQTSGDVTGSVADQSGGTVADAKVTLKDNSKGAVQQTETNKDGVYHFYLFLPVSYGEREIS